MDNNNRLSLHLSLLFVVIDNIPASHGEGCNNVPPLTGRGMNNNNNRLTLHLSLLLVVIDNIPASHGEGCNNVPPVTGRGNRQGGKTLSLVTVRGLTLSHMQECRWFSVIPLYCNWVKFRGGE